MTVDLKIIGQKLLKKYPEIAKSLINEPTFSDFNLIVQIRTIIEADPRLNGKNNYQIRELIVAVIIKLYDPDYIESHKNMKKGLRCAMSTTLQCSPRLISYLSKKVHDLMFIYRSFESDVSYFVEIISKSDLKQQTWVK